MKIIVYFPYFNQIGGIETYIYNWCAALHDQYDITVICESGSPQQLRRIYEYVNVEIFNPSKTYQCDILINHCSWKKTPNNFHSKKTYKIIHADYEIFDKQYGLHLVNDADGYIAVSNNATESAKNIYNMKVDTIFPFMGKVPERQKILRLISATRLTVEKGFTHMLDLIKKFREKNIPIEWHVYTDSTVNTEDYPEIIKHDTELSIASKLSNYDYLVQLSDTETFCYSVREALQCGVPVICGKIPAFEGVVIDGYNGYKLNLTMEDVDVEMIYNNIPRDFTYDSHENEIANAWRAILGNPKPQTRKSVETLTLKALMSYNDIQLNRYVNEGELIEVDPMRALELINCTNTRPALCRVIERGNS